MKSLTIKKANFQVFFISWIEHKPGRNTIMIHRPSSYHRHYRIHHNSLALKTMWPTVVLQKIRTHLRRPFKYNIKEILNMESVIFLIIWLKDLNFILPDVHDISVLNRAFVKIAIQHQRQMWNLHHDHFHPNL